MNKVNFSMVENSIHATLTRGHIHCPEHFEQALLGCHGTLNGTYANESDQPEKQP